MSFFGKRKGVSPTSGGDGGVFSISDEYRMQQLRTIYNDPGTLSPSDASDVPLGHTATGGIISDWLDPSPGIVYRTHIFTSSGTFDVSALSGTYPAAIDFLVVGGGGGAGGDGFGNLTGDGG